jgi:hypothetical protein
VTEAKADIRSPHGRDTLPWPSHRGGPGELVRCAVAAGWPHTHSGHAVEKIEGKTGRCYLLSNFPDSQATSTYRPRTRS